MTRSVCSRSLVLILLAVRLSSVVAFCALFLSAKSLAQSTASPYTPDAGNIGLPANGVFSGGSIDSVQVNNGNLHVDIPLLHLPGIGIDTDIHFVYDISVFTLSRVPYYWSAGNTGSTPDSCWNIITMSRYPATVTDPLSGVLKLGKHMGTWECGGS